MAGGPGFEPELPGPEPGVLPLNYPPKFHVKSTKNLLYGLISIYFTPFQAK